MKNLLLSTFFFLVIGFGSANANSDSKNSENEPAKTEVATDQSSPNETSADEESTVIEIKINGAAVSGYSWWKATLLVIWAVIIIIFVMRTFREKASV